MGKVEWAALAAAVATVVTALLGSLAGLGEHAPGVVAGLLMAAPVLVLAVILGQQLEATRIDALKREADYATAFKDNALALQAMTTAITRLCEAHSMENRIADLEAAAKEVSDARAA